MKKAFVAVAATLLLATAGWSISLEMDLDGVQGDGVDLISVPVSTNFTADIWLLSTGPCWWVFGAFLCDGAHDLGYVSTTYFSPGGSWAFVTPLPPDANGCITIQGQNLSFDVPMCAPWKVATVTYHAAVDHALAEIMLGAQSGVLTTGFVTSSFTNDETVVGQIQIGEPQTGTEETNWGAVKSLFR